MYSLPFETISTRVMTDKKNQGALSHVREIWRESGILGFYSGWEAYPVLSLKPAIQETIIDQSKMAWLAWVGRPALEGFEGFALGGWGRILTTMLMYPVFKVRLLISSGNMRGLGVAGTVAQIVGEQGIRGLYAGMGPELVRGTLYQCFLTGSKELMDGVNGRLLSAMFGRTV
jgi:solute carrier family 25 (peroxisomal adenine nucleotide transporter), member 17